MTAATLLFDLDGTLIDSRPGVVDSFQHAMIEMGEPLDPAFPLDFVLGPPLAESFQRLLRDPTVDRVKLAVRAYRTRYAAVAISGATLFPGIVDMLSAFADRGRRMMVATSKQERFAKQILDCLGLAPLFEVICGEALDGGRGTKRAVIDYLIERHGVEPALSVMIGDREHDILAGNAAGLRTIGVAWGYAAPGELAAAGAGVIVPSPGDLLDVVP